MSSDTPIKLPKNASMQEFQSYIYQLESMHGWLSVDLINNCFLMGEEVGELFKAVRKHQRFFVEKNPEDEAISREHIGDEIVDVFNYLLAIANRLDIDMEEAFRRKNAINQGRSWGGSNQDPSSN